MLRNSKNLLVLIPVLTLFSCGGGREKKTGEGLHVEVESLKVTNSVAAIDYTGSYDYHRIEAAVTELMNQLQENNLTPAGEPFVIYYNFSTDLPEESLNWTVCIPLGEGAKVSPASRIKIVNLPPALFAYTLYSGRYHDLVHVYEQLADWIDENGLIITGPALEFWPGDGEGSPESIKIKLGFIVNVAPDTLDEEIVPEGLEDEEGASADEVTGG